MYRLIFGIVTLAIGLFGAAAPALAQTYPDRPIRWIIPWPPGGGADVIARLMGNQVAEELGKPVVIENRAGAAGNIGAQQAARSAPDGYTIVFAYSGTHSINRHLYKEMTFEENDFTPVVFLSDVPQMLVVNANLPVKSVGDLIALARANPGKLTFGSSGNGAINHLAGQLFASMADVKLTHIPYKGGAPAASAVMSGEIDMIFGEPATLLPFVESGRLRAIATTGAKRSVGMPDLPTIAESGVPGYDVTSWNGVLAPAGTPPDVIARLNAAFNKVLAEPEMRARLVKIGYEPVGGAPERFSQKIERETRKWGPVIKEAGLQMN